MAERYAAFQIEGRKVTNIPSRPFYTKFAWAYDAIISAPISKRCDFIDEVLSDRGVLVGSRLLDAGCGPGGYAIELAQRGFVVTGIDVSPQLIEVAQSKLEDGSLPPMFEVADILNLPRKSTYHAILCRGVLNDLIEDSTREGAFLSFSGALKRGGVLILDVRDWSASVAGIEDNATFKRSAETPEGKLTVRSITQIDNETRRLLVSERHTLRRGDVETISDYDFTMRCWTQQELHVNLTKAGFDFITYLGDYQKNKTAGTTDRIVAIASLS